MPTPPKFENTYAQLSEGFFAEVSPAQVPKPSLVRLNRGLCKELGVDTEWLLSDDGVAMLAGNTLPDSSSPIAMAYAGHQFGGFNPQLGDGRAILLGEVVDSNGVRRDIQLKGSGRTSFSRGGDGKASLGSVIREYIVGEAMFALGVPTTRALAVVTTGEDIARQTPLPGAVLTRVAQSHVRVGTFQFFHARRDLKSVRELADYVIERHFPSAAASESPYLALFESMAQAQAKLIAKWMQLGFIHGVMNTDNMQVVGETIDYGPCAFMDEFHPKCVFSSIDRQGRYAWDNQPAIGQWNLTRLGETLLSLLSDNEKQAVTHVEDVLERYNERFNDCFLEGFSAKLGIENSPSEELDDNRAFIRSTFMLMSEQRVDFTLFFRGLTEIALGRDDDKFVREFRESQAAGDFLVDWRQRLAAQNITQSDAAAAMQKVNPVYIPRNHRVEEAIVAARGGDYTPFERLVRVLQTPYTPQPENAEYEQAPSASEKVHETFCGT